MPIDLLDLKREREATTRQTQAQPGKQVQQNKQPIDLLDLKKQREASARQAQSQQNKQPPGALYNMVAGLGNMGLGAIEGAAQSTYDMAKSAGNFALDNLPLQSMLGPIANSKMLQYGLNDDSDSLNPEFVAPNSPMRNPMEFLGGQTDYEISKIPELEIQQKNPESTARSFGQFAGRMAPKIAGAMALGPMAVPAAESLAASAGLSSPYALAAARTAGAGLGGFAEGYITGNEDNRFFDGAFSGALSGGFQLGLEALKGMRYLSDKNIRNSITKHAEALQSQEGPMYKKATKMSKDLGIDRKMTKIDPNNVPLEYFKGEDKKLAEQALNAYNKKPSLEAAHQLESDIGKLIYRNAPSGGKVTNVEKTAHRQAIEQWNNLKSSIQNQLVKHGGEEGKKVVELLNQAKQFTSKTYDPFKHNKEISEILRNKNISDKNFMNAVRGNQKFLNEAEHLFPDLQTQRQISDIMKHLKTVKDVGIVGLAGKEIYDTAASKIQNNI